MQPLHNVGKYGGTWRRGFIGPSDSENGNRLRSGEKLIFFDADRHRAAAERRQGLGGQRGRAAHHAVPAQAA